MTAPAAGLILAAGRSTRFGSDKLKAAFRGKQMLEHVIDAAVAAGLAPLVVVVGSDRQADWLLARSTRLVVNPDPARGLSSSLQLGLAALERETHVRRVAILLGDQPMVSATVMAALIIQPTDRPIVVPRYADGRPGNPVLLERAAWPLAAQLSGDRGMVQLFAMRRELVHYVDVTGANPDVDTPGELHALEGRPEEEI